MLQYVLGTVAIVLMVTLLIPGFRTLLKFGPPDWVHLAGTIALGAVLFITLEWLKPFANRRAHTTIDHAGSKAVASV